MFVEKLPEVVRIEPSSLCNARCIHCPTGMHKYKGGVMSEAVFSKVVAEIKAVAPRTVVMYHGGEPFINNRMTQMIADVKSCGNPFVKTDTNGMLLTERMMCQIIESGLDYLSVSIDGLSPEENDRIRVGCDYGLVVGKVKQLVALKKHYGSRTPEIVVSNCQIPTTYQGNNDKLPAPPDFLVKEFGSEVAIKTCYALRWPGLGGGREIANPTVTYCENTMKFITIRWNGDVVPCCYDITSRYVIGNILESTIAELWNNDRYLALRQSIQNKKYVPLCRDCHFINPERMIVDAAV